MFTLIKWKAKLLTIWITFLNQLKLLHGSHLLSDVFLNIIKYCTQKLWGRASTIYFTTRKDAPDHQAISWSQLTSSWKVCSWFGAPDQRLHGEESAWLRWELQLRQGPSSRASAWNQLSCTSPCKPSPGAVRDVSQCHQLHCAKGGSELRQTKPHHGRKFAQGPSSTVVYMQTCYCCEDSLLQLDCFIYLLPDHCKREVNYLAIAEEYRVCEESIKNSQLKKGNLLWHGNLVVCNLHKDFDFQRVNHFPVSHCLLMRKNGQRESI